MSRIWVVASHEFVVTIRRPGFIVMTLVVPLLGAIALLAASLYGGQASSFLEQQFSGVPSRIGVVDRAGGFTPIPSEFQNQFTAYPDNQAAQAAVASGEVGGALIIPADYLQTGQVTIVTKSGGLAGTMLQESQQVRSFLVSQLLNERVDPLVQARAASPLEPVLVSLDSGGEGSGTGVDVAVNLMLPYFLGVLLVVTIFTASGYLLRSVAEEKTNRVIEIVLSSISAQQLLAGKVLGLGAAGLLQVVIWLVSAVALSGGAFGLLGIAIPLLTRPEILVLAIVYYLLGFLVYAVLMGTGGALGTSMQESQQLAGIFSFMAAIPFMMVGFLFTNPNITIARVLSWFPLTSPTMMLLRLPLSDVPWIDIAGSIGMLLITIPFLVWGGSKIFRMGLLMYGKRASLQQIARELRRA